MSPGVDKEARRIFVAGVLMSLQVLKHVLEVLPRVVLLEFGWWMARPGRSHRVTRKHAWALLTTGSSVGGDTQPQKYILGAMVTISVARERVQYLNANGKPFAYSLRN